MYSNILIAVQADINNIIIIKKEKIMKFKKIASSIFALLLITGATTSNSSIINKIVPKNTITAYAASNELISTESTLKWNYDTDYIDSTGNWKIRLDDSASMAQIDELVDTSIIRSGKKLYIPSYVTVTLTDSSNKEYYHTVPVTSIGTCVFCDILLILFLQAERFLNTVYRC